MARRGAARPILAGACLVLCARRALLPGCFCGPPAAAGPPARRTAARGMPQRGIDFDESETLLEREAKRQAKEAADLAAELKNPTRPEPSFWNPNPQVPQAPQASPEKSAPVAAGAAGVGDALPEITLPDQNGQRVSLSAFKDGLFPWEAGKPVVLFFFAGSASPSCTKECQAFRDNYAKFEEKGATVIGVSLDNPMFNSEFKEKEGLPFDLLSDEGGSTAKALQIPKDLFGFLNGRQTYVIGKDGKIKKVFNNQFEPEKHVDESLAAL